MVGIEFSTKSVQSFRPGNPSRPKTLNLSNHDAWKQGTLNTLQTTTNLINRKKPKPARLCPQLHLG